MGFVLNDPRRFALSGCRGAVTLVLAGLLALVQTDIKRVLAYCPNHEPNWLYVLKLWVWVHGMRQFSTNDSCLL